MSTFSTILFEKKDKIAFVTLNRPKVMNALGFETIEELSKLFCEMQADQEIQGVIISGEGKAFCAGADLSGSKNSQGNPHFSTRDFVIKAQNLMNQIEEFPHPVIAAVNGFALGGGLELALSCDIRIASEDALFGLPETTIGVIPCFGGTQRLPRAIGVSNAKDMIYTGRKVRAAEAKEFGIVSQVSSDVLKDAEEKMNQIIANAPLAIKLAKTAINKGLEMPLNYALELEADMTALLGTTEDAKEGGLAFYEKRKPSFKNR